MSFLRVLYIFADVCVCELYFGNHSSPNKLLNKIMITKWIFSRDKMTSIHLSKRNVSFTRSWAWQWQIIGSNIHDIRQFRHLYRTCVDAINDDKTIQTMVMVSTKDFSLLSFPQHKHFQRDLLTMTDICDIMNMFQSRNAHTIILIFNFLVARC